MKNGILVILLGVKLLNAQIEIKDQPQNWFMQTWSIHQIKMVEKNELLNLKPTTLPENFGDTLRTYDWVELGGYLYEDGGTTTHYNEKYPDYKIIRLDENDTVLHFQYTATYNNMEEGTINHTNFKNMLGTNPVWKFKKIGNRNYIYDINNNEYLFLISYSNGLLVYDIPMNGKLNDKKIFARLILMARKKEFVWSKNE